MAGLRLDLGRVDQDLTADLEKEENQEEVEEMDPLSGDEHQLTSLERIEKFSQSDSIMDRDIAVRSVIEAAYAVTVYSEFESILDMVYPMASDHEPLIRVGVLGTVTTLVERNSEFREKEEVPFGQENEDRLYEIPVKMLNDYNQQVRRVSHNCIIALLDEPRRSIDSLIKQLCVVIKKCLGREENYDLRMDTALLISRVSPLIDPELCRVHFVPLLSSLAVDSMFHVRKAFAMCCRDFCPVVGEECSERDILPLFLQLCKDEVWGVRKACADVFMDMSASCSLNSRHEKLTPVFLQLLKDDSRWVRKAAFQSLGPFISTFYNQLENCQSSSEENSNSFDPIGESELQDDSFLQTSDSSLESRNQPVAIVTNNYSPTEEKLNSPVSSSSSANHVSSAVNHSTSSTVVNSHANTTSTVVTSHTSFVSPSHASTTVVTNHTSSMSNHTSSMSLNDTSTSAVTGHTSFVPRGNVSSNTVATSHVPSTVTASHIPKSVSHGPSPPISTNTFQSTNQKLNHNIDGSSSIRSPEGNPETMAASSPKNRGDDDSQDEFSSFQFWRLPIPGLPLDNNSPDSSTSSTTMRNKNQSTTVSEIDRIMAAAAGRRTGGGDVVTGGDIGDIGIPDDDMSGDNNVFREGEGEECDDDRGDLTDIKDELLAESEGMEISDDKGSKAYSEGVIYSEGTCSALYPQSTTGQILEEELMSGCGLSTINKSVAMEMTTVNCSETTFTIIENKQSIVPEELIDMYLSMTDPLKSQSIDAELPFYCAFSFPAVLQTLGSDNWALLKPTFEALATDMQWKIRRVLAFSLHEIAVILGQDKTVSDLLSVVDEYCTKDLDDVKFGVLNHLAEFFEMLPDDVRKDCFPYVLNGLLDTENERNWRYRNLLAEQLIQVAGQCECLFVAHHIAPVAIKLAYDRVACVRDTSLRLIGTILQKFNHSSPKLCGQMLTEVRKNFSINDRWLLRLLFVKLCQMIYEKKLVNLSLFAVECIPTIISLSKDVVPNVRMAVGKLLNQAMANTDYFSFNSHYSQDIQHTVETLQSDPDRDVRFYSGASPYDLLTPRIPEQNCNDDVFFTQPPSSDGTEEDSQQTIDITRAADLLHSS